MLDVIDKGHCTAAHPVPLLFVHGGWHAAWCWEDHFLDFFAENGFRAVAVSLRAHGKSATSQRLRTCSIADYVDDVRTAAAGLDIQPVIVGHSMGGFVVQKFLETHHAPACVLMASAPPNGWTPSCGPCARCSAVQRYRCCGLPWRGSGTRVNAGLAGRCPPRRRRLAIDPRLRPGSLDREAILASNAGPGFRASVRDKAR